MTPEDCAAIAIESAETSSGLWPNGAWLATKSERRASIGAGIAAQIANAIRTRLSRASAQIA